MMAILTGIKKHWKRIPEWALGLLGGCWLVVEVLSFFYLSLKTYAEKNATFFWIAYGFLTVVFVIYRIRSPHTVEFTLPTTNSVVCLRFGDLFSANGHIVVPVNEYFDSKIRLCVSPASVHGKLIQEVLSGNSEQFDEAVEKSLKRVPHEVVRRKSGKASKYPIGTTAVMNAESKKYFLFALTTTDITDNKARADVPQMWRALEGLWKKVRSEANGIEITLPVVGGGLSGVGIEPVHLIRLIILSILTETRKQQVAQRFEIVVLPALSDDIDLEQIASDWN